MTRHPLTARHVLVVAPHPDDEAIGAWALMRHLRRRGASLEIIVVSDGGASHPGSRTWPRSRLIAERRRETRRAMATLALSPAHICFLALPDGELAADQTTLDRALRRAYARRPQPDLIVGPVPGDAHADHDAVARALLRRPRRGECRIGYRVWPAEVRRRRSALHIALDPHAMLAKRRVLRGYRTQNGRISDAQDGFAMTRRHLRAFAGPVERFERLA